MTRSTTNSAADSPANSPITAVTGLLCFVLVTGGASGLCHEWLGWIRFLGFVRLLVPDGHEVAGYTVMIAVGAATGVAGEVLARRGRR